MELSITDRCPLVGFFIPAAGILAEEVTEAPVTEITEVVTVPVTSVSEANRNGVEAVGIYIDGELAGCGDFGLAYHYRLDDNNKLLRRDAKSLCRQIKEIV